MMMKKKLEAEYPAPIKGQEEALRELSFVFNILDKLQDVPERLQAEYDQLLYEISQVIENIRHGILNQPPGMNIEKLKSKAEHLIQSLPEK